MVRPGFYATLAAAALALPAYGQTEAMPPSDYALTHARIVVAPGSVIERGTIRVTDGKIMEVGADVDVPEGVVELDMTGRTVYPGLIDAATSMGLPRVAPQGDEDGRGGGPGGPLQAEEAGTRRAPPPQVRPGQMAADVFAPSSSDLEAMRAAGVTTLGLAFETGGIFPGQVGVVSTGSGDPAELVLRTPVALQVTFGRRSDGYPNTLMGAIAYIKQAFLDAEYDARVAAAFERDPSAAPRPSYDAEHRALAPAVEGTLPVWFVGETDRDLDRIADLAAELGVQNYTFVGAQQAWKATELLTSAPGRPVIVSLDFPEPDDVTGRAFELHVAPPAGDDTAGEEADSAAARAARGNAAALAQAGVSFALSSYGLDSPADFRDGILAAVEAGLAADEALRALTITPARMLGLEDATGTIEAGKLANLVVVEGDLFTDSARIRAVFVEGEHFEIHDRPDDGDRDEDGDTPRVAGEWSGSVEGPSGTLAFTLTLERDGDAVTGSLTSEMGTVELEGDLDGADVTLNGTMRPQGMNAMDLTITGTITDDELEGTIAMQGQADMPFSARRREPGRSANNSHAIQGGGQ